MLVHTRIQHQKFFIHETKVQMMLGVGGTDDGAKAGIVMDNAAKLLRHAKGRG